MTTLLPTPGVQNLPAAIQQVIQDGFLLRFFNDSLFTQLIYRSSYDVVTTPAHLGQSFTFTRKGLLDVVQDPLTPINTADNLSSGITPTYSGKEQYSVTMNQYANAIETNALSSSVSIVNLYRENVEDLGLNAGQSLDIQARRRMMLAYNGFRSYVLAPVGPTASVSLDNIAGLDFVYDNGVRFVTSVTNPHPVTISENGVPTTRDVIGVTPGARDNSDDTVPGSVTLSSNVTVVAGDYIISDFAPQSIRPNGKRTAFNLASNDILTLQSLIDAAAGLRSRGVAPHDDGYFHAVMDSTSVAQLWQDAAFQRAFQSLPDSAEYQFGAAGTIGGVKIFETQQAPNSNNLNGLKVRRILVTGKEIGYEARFEAIARWLELAGASPGGAIQFSSEAWVAMILRNPIDTLQQTLKNSWSFIGDWVAVTDSLTSFGGSSAYYKRGCVIETA